jgi:serine/threonine protein phosphatase PrpC
VIYKTSHIGRYHKEINGENQDYICTIQDGPNTVISLADGVSSCSRSKTGAEVAGNVVSKLLIRRGGSIMKYESDEIADITTAHILAELKRKARHDKSRVEEYSSTVASVLYDRKHKRLLCINLGDSIIIATSGNDCRIIAIPFDSSEGCCVTTTRNSALAVTAKVLSADRIDSVIICSDGAWRHMFKGSRLKQEVSEMLRGNAFDELRDYLNEQDCSDDYSFVAMNIGTRRLA